MLEIDLKPQTRCTLEFAPLPDLPLGGWRRQRAEPSGCAAVMARWRSQCLAMGTEVRCLCCLWAYVCACAGE